MKITYRSFDGQEFDSELEALKHERGAHYNCIKCCTSGKMDSGKKETYYRPQTEGEKAFGDQWSWHHSVKDERPVYIACDLCNGFGYTKEKYTPIVKTTEEIIGFKLKHKKQYEQ